MLYSLKSVFIISVLTLSLVTQSAIIENTLKVKNRIQEDAIGFPGTSTELPVPPLLIPSLTDQPKPHFPPFGSLVAPRVTNNKDLMGHGPLSKYTVKYLDNLTLDEAKQLKDKLVKKQWDKHETREENIRFMYLLDEALYDVGIALDFNIRDIMSKLDLLSKHEIIALDPPNLFNIKKSAKDASKQVLRRYLTLGQLNYIKRYIDYSIKNILEVDKKST